MLERLPFAKITRKCRSEFQLLSLHFLSIGYCNSPDKSGNMYFADQVKLGARIPSMVLVLDKLMSLQFWRRIYPLNRAPRISMSNSSLTFEECVVYEEDIERLMPSWATFDLIEAAGGLIDVLTFDRSQRRKSGKRVVRSMHSSVPKGSFFQTTGGVFIASPTFIFLEFARILTIEQLIALGDELCGTYSFDERFPRGIRRRETPLIKKTDIARYLNGADGCFGLNNARRALSYIVENSASPKETECEMLGCLPYRYGGYGLDVFTMNHPVPLDEKARRIAKRETCYIDLCYPDLFFGFEFQGVYDHSEASSFDSDRARINGLKQMGYDIIELTYGQVDDLWALEDLFLYAAKLSKKRIKPQYLGASQQRVRLRQMLKQWNQSGGMP